MTELLFATLITIYWFGLAAVNASLAKHKADSPPLFFFASLFFGPLVYLYLLALPNKS